MRIAIISAPKTGNHWLKCLLGAVYDLTWLDGTQTPVAKPAAFADWVARGGFPDGSIFHHHARYSPTVADAVEQAPGRLATIVRDPYDGFVSLYAWSQDRASQAADFANEQRARPRDVLKGKPIDHPDVLAFLADGFGAYLTRADGWLRSGRATVVRYEGLHRDLVAELSAATDRIGGAEPARIVRAIDACRAATMRTMNETLAWHVRSAQVGESKERLSETHLAIFRDRHADTVRRLGYELR